MRVHKGQVCLILLLVSAMTFQQLTPPSCYGAAGECVIVSENEGLLMGDPKHSLGELFDDRSNGLSDAIMGLYFAVVRFGPEDNGSIQESPEAAHLNKVLRELQSDELHSLMKHLESESLEADLLASGLDGSEFLEGANTLIGSIKTLLVGEAQIALPDGADATPTIFATLASAARVAAVFVRLRHLYATVRQAAQALKLAQKAWQAAVAATRTTPAARAAVYAAMRAVDAAKATFREAALKALAEATVAAGAALAYVNGWLNQALQTVGIDDINAAAAAGAFGVGYSYYDPAIDKHFARDGILSYRGAEALKLTLQLDAVSM